MKQLPKSIFLAFLLVAVNSFTANPFEKIDKIARECPGAVAKNIDDLAAYLNKYATTDLERARGIYVWLATFISYDDLAYNTKLYGRTDAESVLASRKSVCEGYANLFQALGERMGLEIKMVRGYAKGYSYRPGDSFPRTNHAWNLIRIEGRWHIFDATWGGIESSASGGKYVSKKRFDDYWFDTDPYQAILSHFPENPEYALVQPLPTLRQFEAWPNVDVDCFRMGFSAEAAFQKLVAGKKISFPECYFDNPDMKMIEAPYTRYLVKGVTRRFEFIIPGAKEVYTIDAGGVWTELTKENDRFSIQYTPIETGKLQIVTSYDEDETYLPFLIYQVFEKQ